MNQPLKIAQVTDLHVGFEGEDTFGVDVRRNFFLIFDAIQRANPDFCVISGDLCYRDGQKEIYDWIQQHISRLPFPVFSIAGNHDNSTLLARSMGFDHFLHDDEVYYRKKIGGVEFLFLDTAKGVCSNFQYDWLAHNLADIGSAPLVIFMHHPPAYGGVPYMDKNHAFREQEKMQQILNAYPGQLPIFCGHYHVEKMLLVNRLQIHITPSCFFQIDDRCEDFKVDHHRISFREIYLDQHGLRNTLRYFF